MKEAMNTVNGQYIGYNMPLNIEASYGPDYMPGTHTINLYGNNPLERDKALNARIEKIRTLHNDNLVILGIVKSLTNRGYAAALSYEIR